MISLRAQDGVAMPVVMGTLTVLTILSGAAATSSLSSHSSSETDRDAKRAIAAAEAGLRQALYRTNNMAPAENQCLTNVAVNPVAGECPGHTVQMGNNTEFTYYVTPVNTSNCAGLQLSTTNVDQRCITAIGQSNQTERRVQMRIGSFKALPLFPVPGMFGRDYVTLHNSILAEPASVGSNGLIDLKNSAEVKSPGTLYIGPTAPSPSIGNSSVAGATIRRTPAEGEFVLAPVEPGDSHTDAGNDNDRIQSGVDVGVNMPYDHSIRHLEGPNSSSLTMGGSIYNFCSLHLKNSAHITIANGAKVRIFIDSPERPGSGCPPNSGWMIIDNSSGFNNPSNNPLNLQVYVYGTSDAYSGNQDQVRFKNSTNFTGVLYAPQSPVTIDNSGEFTGGVAGKSIDYKNSVKFHWNPGVGDLKANTTTQYFRTGWRQCKDKQTISTDPESGC